MNARRPPGGGGFGRAAPRRRLILVAMGVAALLLGGCALNPCNSCGPVNPVRRLGQRVFNRNAPPCADCGEPGFIGGADVPVGVAAPPAVVADPPAAVIQGGPAATSPPAAEAPPLDLRPLDEGQGGGTDGASRSSTGKAVYETLRPRDGLSTARRDGQGRAGGRDGSDPLANFIPKLEAPSTLEGAQGAVPPAAETLPADKPEASRPDATAGEAPAASPASSAFLTPPAEADPALSSAPGIPTFKAVEPKLAGGSLPSAAGWSWLADQGFRTVLDLRPSDQFRHEDLARINSSGLRYVPLPIEDAAVGEPSALARFAFELAQDPARPLYFFDTDGSRSAVMWYLHEVVNHKADPRDAAREADEIGRRDAKLWERATAYVQRLQPPAVTPGPAPSAPAPSAPAPPEAPVPDVDPGQAAPSANPPSPKAALVPSGDAQTPAPTVAQGPASPAVPPTAPAGASQPAPLPPPADTSAWRPFAALAAAGMSVPLAFLGRSALSHVARSRPARASLTGPGRSPSALPDASGE